MWTLRGLHSGRVWYAATTLATLMRTWMREERAPRAPLTLFCGGRLATQREARVAVLLARRYALKDGTLY